MYMCKKINNNIICECEWELIATWVIMIKGDLVQKMKYKCICCGDIKIEE